MAGLVPAIHVFQVRQIVDARHKAGHDEVCCYASTPVPMGHVTPVPPSPQ